MKNAAMALVCMLSFDAAAGAADAVQTASEAQRHSETAHRPGEAQRGRICFNSAETREKIVARRLSEPFRLLRGAAGRVQGEALRAKLCRWNEEYIYEIALLRRDGRVVRVYLNATSGQAVGAYDER